MSEYKEIEEEVENRSWIRSNMKKLSVSSFSVSALSALLQDLPEYQGEVQQYVGELQQYVSQHPEFAVTTGTASMGIGFTGFAAYHTIEELRTRHALYTVLEEKEKLDTYLAEHEDEPEQYERVEQIYGILDDASTILSNSHNH